jgi:hypothetical protein
MMKFRVSRTSDWHNEKPCKEAKKEPYTRVDMRTARPEDIPAHKGEDPAWWFSEGTNHREVKGPRGGFQGIARDFDDEDWFVEIGTLDELVKFTDKYGSIVLTWFHYNPDIREIEIYDGYRE